MPESKKRKKAYEAPNPSAVVRKKGPSPVWLAPLMLALFLVGILWLVAFYLIGADLPAVGGLGSANLLIGFGFIVAGFALATQWR